jgi:hypothetical protein
MLVCDSSIRVMWSFSSWKTWLRVERTRRKPLSHKNPQYTWTRMWPSTNWCCIIHWKIIPNRAQIKWESVRSINTIKSWGFGTTFLLLDMHRVLHKFHREKGVVVFTSVAARNNCENKHPFILQSTMKTPNWTHICTNVLSSILIATGTNVLQKKKSWHPIQSA